MTGGMRLDPSARQVALRERIIRLTGSKRVSVVSHYRSPPLRHGLNWQHLVTRCAEASIHGDTMPYCDASPFPAPRACDVMFN
jgi:hypothetical protein